MDASKLQPILNKESILKTANARELQQAPDDVLKRYQSYALTHVPLGDTTRQLRSLERVVADNQKCAIGTIVGPYGYGKTSTAVHLWNELRETRVLAVPPFLWVNLQQLIDAVYHWVRYEFQQGPAKYVERLDALHQRYAESGFDRLPDGIAPELAHQMYADGLLNLVMRPDDVVEFYSAVADLCLEAGYRGLAVFTDELQATVAEYKPSRDQFFNDLFQIVKDTIDRPGKWAIVLTMDDGTEGIISQMRSDLLQRMQRSALYFRVKDVYSRREYPAQLWDAFGERFGFDGRQVIHRETLESMGEIASRDDLGAGPRMVTNALSLAVRQYEQTGKAYTPLDFVNAFLEGQVLFDQRGKFTTAVNRALENAEVRNEPANRDVVKLLAAYPAGCPDAVLQRFGLLDSYNTFPPLARRDLFVNLSEGTTLRFLLEEERPPEYVEQRLTQEFVRRYAPGRPYAEMAAQGFLHHVLLSDTFNGWKPAGKLLEQKEGHTRRFSQRLTGSFDAKRFPQRSIRVVVAALPQSPTPVWPAARAEDDVDLELRFELNYNLPETEPSRLLVSPERPNAAVFQLNLSAIERDVALKVLPELLFQYYSADKFSPLLTLALLRYLNVNSGDLPDDVNRVRVVGNPLRQFALTLLLGERLQADSEEFASNMVGHERVRELGRTQFRLLYPHYETLIAGPKWTEELQYYTYAIEKVAAEDGVAVVRGRRAWETTKTGAADAFTIPGRSLSRLETLLNSLSRLIVAEEYSGRTADSPIRLRFQLHPLEKQWLEELEASKEIGRTDAGEGPALYAVELIRAAQRQGYLPEEVQSVLGLLQSRKYVAMDKRKGLLVRRAEESGELKEEIDAQLVQLELDMARLKEAIIEFEPQRYPVADLRGRLAETNDRDGLEVLKSEVWRIAAGVRKYATSRAEGLRERYSRSLEEMREQVQFGVPPWLSRPFADSPLKDLLEQQRKHYAGAYETVLRDMRQLTAESAETLQSLPESPIEVIEMLQKALPESKREREKLETRRKSYSDLKYDLDAWHKIIEEALGQERALQTVGQRYDTDEWDVAMSHLWEEQRQAIVANPLDLPSLHKPFRKRAGELAGRFNKWLQNRREDFEQQRERYEAALAEAGIRSPLRIPFNEQNPAESYSALFDTVHQHLAGYVADLQRRLGQVQQRARYAEQVQHADLAATRADVARLLATVEGVAGQLSAAALRDMAAAERDILRPLREVHQGEAAAAAAVQHALGKRPPEEREEALLQSLRALANGNEVDLYSLIVRQLESAPESFDLDQLTHDLQMLFQKNQVGIRIRLL